MLNILLILIFPFIPVWLYDDWNSVFSNSPLCQREGFVICEKKEKVLGMEDEPLDFSKAGEYNLFPVEEATASGFMPIRRDDSAGELKLWAGSSVAIDVDSGTILHYENGRKRMPIASLTKMMTAILVLEKIGNMNEEVTITAGAINLAGTNVGCPTSVFCNSNRMYPGEKVRAVDLLKATLMNSANDAAVSLAIHIAGSEKEFVKMMNGKAREMGLRDTNFCTASGLEPNGQENQCYSSAYDIARIAAYSLQHEEIWNIMRIPDGRFYSSDGKYMHELKNTDLLLDIMPNCIGGKTGFTPLAGKSLLLGAIDPAGKHRIITVVLNDEKRWENTRLLVDWVFDNYKWR